MRWASGGEECVRGGEGRGVERIVWQVRMENLGDGYNILICLNHNKFSYKKYFYVSGDNRTYLFLVVVL